MKTDSNNLREIIDTIRGSETYAVEKLHLNFTEDLLERMESLGVNQTALAEKMGCSRSYISKAFNKPSNFTLETIAKMAFALNLEVKIQLTDKNGVIKMTRSIYEEVVTTKKVDAVSRTFFDNIKLCSSNLVRKAPDILNHDYFSTAA